jgi:glycerol 3-phosphatase-1
VLVLEDSPAGIRAGKQAGCKVLAVVTSHTAAQVLSAGPDWVVRDLASVRLVQADSGRVTLEIRDGLVASGV